MKSSVFKDHLLSSQKTNLSHPKDSFESRIFLFLCGGTICYTLETSHMSPKKGREFQIGNTSEATIDFQQILGG